jgi:serine/threonine protein phosphatase PrpC
MKVAMLSHTGLIRQNNQDHAGYSKDIHDCTLAIVADGMGGHQGGEVASEMAVQLISDSLHHLACPLDPLVCKEALFQAVTEANRIIYSKALSDPLLSGMGTTVVASIATPEWFQVAHIGDSRCYLVSEEKIECLTFDHSLVGELVRTGQLTLEEAREHPQRNVLLRALGTEPDVNLDWIQLDWGAASQLLLCSDGLTNMVSEELIHSILLSDLTIDQKVEKLVEKALNAGGPDNITVIVISREE